MALTVNSFSQFKLYLAEPSDLRSCYRVDLDKIHDVTSNQGFQVDFCPKERKDFIKGNKSKFITEWDLAVINITQFPFKALKKYIEYQFDEHLSEQVKVWKSSDPEEDLSYPYIDPRIVLYRRFDQETSERFQEKFARELESAFKTTFALTAFNSGELNNILIEILNLRRKNRIMSN